VIESPNFPVKRERERKPV